MACAVAVTCAGGACPAGSRSRICGMRPTGAAARPSSRPSFCDLWCGRDTLDLIEPPVMLDSAIRNELRGKEFPIRILIASPAFADDPAVQFQYGSLFLFIIPVQDPARKSAIDDEMGRFGMPAGISGSDRVALRQAEEDKLFETGTIDDRVRILDQAFERNFRYVALRQSRALSAPQTESVGQ
jgi:hypothetical protein